jgi:hypothetical protein
VRHPLAFEQLTTIDDYATHLRTLDYLIPFPTQNPRSRRCNTSEIGMGRYPSESARPTLIQDVHLRRNF